MPNSNGWGDGTANNTIGWGQGSINNTIGWGSTYAVSDAGLTDIVGASPAPPAFAFTAKTDNTGVSTSTQFQLPLTTSTGLNILVDWGDASTSTITSHTDPAVTHTYASAGTYSISITGTLPGFQFNGVGDNFKDFKYIKLGSFRYYY
jgi:PKD repeat protein